jgi:hypothetical protein
VRERQVGEAATIAGKSERTLRNWCVEHGIGRRIAGGAWAVSRVALQMVLEGDLDGLSAGNAREGTIKQAPYGRRNRRAEGRPTRDVALPTLPGFPRN